MIHTPGHCPRRLLPLRARRSASCSAATPCSPAGRARRVARSATSRRSRVHPRRAARPAAGDGRAHRPRRVDHDRRRRGPHRRVGGPRRLARASRSDGVHGPQGRMGSASARSSMDRATGFYPVGWGFESLRAHPCVVVRRIVTLVRLRRRPRQQVSGARLELRQGLSRLRQPLTRGCSEQDRLAFGLDRPAMDLLELRHLDGGKRQLIDVHRARPRPSTPRQPARAPVPRSLGRNLDHRLGIRLERSGSALLEHRLGVSSGSGATSSSTGSTSGSGSTTGSGVEFRRQFGPARPVRRPPRAPVPEPARSQAADPALGRRRGPAPHSGATSSSSALGSVHSTGSRTARRCSLTRRGLLPLRVLRLHRQLGSLGEVRPREPPEVEGLRQHRLEHRTDLVRSDQLAARAIGGIARGDRPTDRVALEQLVGDPRQVLPLLGRELTTAVSELVVAHR